MYFLVCAALSVLFLMRSLIVDILLNSFCFLLLFFSYLFDSYLYFFSYFLLYFNFFSVLLICCLILALDLSVSLCICLSLPQTEVCLASDILCSKLRAVQRCVDSLLLIGGVELKEEMKAHTPSLSPFSLVPTGFLLFYCLVMGLLYLLYHHLTA